MRVICSKIYVWLKLRGGGGSCRLGTCHGYGSMLILVHWRKNRRKKSYPEDCILLRKVY